MKRVVPYRQASDTQGGERRPPPPRQLLLVGVIVSIASLAVMFIALFVGASMGKYIVAFALAGFFVGLALLVNGFIDWFKGGRL